MSDTRHVPGMLMGGGGGGGLTLCFNGWMEGCSGSCELKKSVWFFPSSQ